MNHDDERNAGVQELSIGLKIHTLVIVVCVLVRDIIIVQTTL